MRRLHKGFTLLEILLALAIFAYAASSIMKLLGSTATNLSEIEQMTLASWVANNRLVELQVEDTWPPKNNAKGQEDMAGRTWYWQQTVQKTEGQDLRAVTVTVFSDETRKAPIYDLTTYVSKFTESNNAQP